MRTKIQGGYVVSFDGEGHRIIRDGVVVYEDNEIIYVGKSYEGDTDRTIDARGRLVSPGFINVHCGTAVVVVPSRLDSPRAGLTVSKAYAVDGVGNLDLLGEDLKTNALIGLVSLIRGGSTTASLLTAMAPSRWEGPAEHVATLARTAGELGLRAYVSHHYRSAVRYWSGNGAVHFHWDEEAGRAGLERGLQFAEEFQGTYGDRIRTMLFPYQFDTCSAGLLRDTREAARQRGLLIQMHTAQSLFEFHESLRRYGKTPVQYLYDTGFLDSDVILAHVAYTTLNPVTGYPNGDTRDIELLAQSGATVAHCPVSYGRGGKMLRSFGQYVRGGVNVAIGEETFPVDMIKAMRMAAIIGKIADRDHLAVTTRDVFNAATLAGAKALGREDLGRLAVGAKADIVIVDLSRLHITDDPIKTLVYMASQHDIETVIVDGKVVVEGGSVPGVDEEELVRKSKEVNERQKMAFVGQNPAGKSADELFPSSFLIE